MSGLAADNAGKGFAPGDRVRIPDDFFWARGATGTVFEPPPEVTAISGPWSGGLTRQEASAVGTNTVYWVWFDARRNAMQMGMDRTEAARSGRRRLRFCELSHSNSPYPVLNLSDNAINQDLGRAFDLAPKADQERIHYCERRKDISICPSFQFFPPSFDTSRR